MARISLRKVYIFTIQGRNSANIQKNYREPQKLGDRIVTYYSSSVFEKVPMPGEHANDDFNNSDHNIDYNDAIDYDGVHIEPKFYYPTDSSTFYPGISYVLLFLVFT